MSLVSLELARERPAYKPRVCGEHCVNVCDHWRATEETWAMVTVQLSDLGSFPEKGPGGYPLGFSGPRNLALAVEQSG